MTQLIEEEAPIESHAEWARRDTERRRLKAYADPETGSDRHFSEAQRLEAQGFLSDAALARSKGLDRYAEIKRLYPYDSGDPEDTQVTVAPLASAKLALLDAGLLELVETFFNDLPEPQRAAALIEWQHRQTLERDHPLVALAAAALELTEQQLDELFVDAGGR